MFQTLFGVNMSIFMGAMAPGSEVTFFLAGTSVSTLSVTIQSKKFSISVIALFDKGNTVVKDGKPRGFMNVVALTTPYTEALLL